MRIAIVASPFIPVPPLRYGGTELFIATLVDALSAKGVDVVVYANGESNVNAELRWRYPHSDWPLAHESAGMTKELDQISWALEDAAEDCDIVHVNSALAVTFSRHTPSSMMCTLHHAYDPALHDLYSQYQNVSYVAISRNQGSLYPDLDLPTIHHGIDLSQYRYKEMKGGYLSFLGRIAPLKGVHTAIKVAKGAGIPLKIAGEIQPIFRDYFEAEVKPHIDGRFIEYVGEADLAIKNELLGGSMGMLFPIQWEEPFGLVMVEAMACGTPVFAFRRGAVPEIIGDGVSGSICTSVEDMILSVQRTQFKPRLVRQWVERNFSADVMASRYLECYRSMVEEEEETDLRPTWEEPGEIAV
jgi:glycosyltransferase involved in cell wall biosynthesis